MPDIRLVLDDALSAALDAHVDALNADRPKPLVTKRAAATALLAAALGVSFTPPARGGWRGNPASLKTLRPRQPKKRREADE